MRYLACQTNSATRQEEMFTEKRVFRDWIAANEDGVDKNYKEANKISDHDSIYGATFLPENPRYVHKNSMIYKNSVSVKTEKLTKEQKEQSNVIKSTFFKRGVEKYVY